MGQIDEKKLGKVVHLIIFVSGTRYLQIFKVKLERNSQP